MIVPSELRAVAEFCDNLEPLRIALLGGGDLSMGDINIFDANGEKIGKVVYDGMVDGFHFDPA